MNSGRNISKIFTDLSQTAVVNIVLVLACTLLLIALSQKSLSWLGNKLSGKYRLLLLASIPLLRLLLIVAALMLVVPQVVEPTVANMVALLGAAGLVLGFGLKDYVSSLIAGIVALYEMPYRPGDWIEVEGAYGEVKQIGMRALEIVTPDDTTVIIPHLKLWDHLIFNANDGGPDLMCVADFYLHPRHDGEPARQALLDVALTSSFLQIESPVVVIVSEKPWGTHYRLKAYPVDLRQQFQFITDMTVRGKDALTRLGMSFASIPAVPQKDG
ncbi:MAG: mechanosensitive ion channel family protein [Desulfobacterales bacterium]